MGNSEHTSLGLVSANLPFSRRRAFDEGPELLDSVTQRTPCHLQIVCRSHQQGGHVRAAAGPPCTAQRWPLGLGRGPSWHLLISVESARSAPANQPHGPEGGRSPLGVKMHRLQAPFLTSCTQSCTWPLHWRPEHPQ